MNIVILSPKDITNINHGAAIRIYNLAKGLAMCNNKVTLISIPYFSKGRFFREKTYQQNLTIIVASLLETIFSLKFFLKKLITATIIQIEFPTFSPLIPILKILGKPVILDEHGVEIEFLNEINAALGKKVSFREYLQTLCLEAIGVKFASCVFTCSRADMEKIQFFYKLPKSKIAVIPNGVSEDFLETVQAYNYGKPTALFIGSFDHAPNLFATKFLLSYIIPILFEKNKEVIFVFVGKNPPYWLSQNSFGGRIKIIRNVKDVRAFIAGANVVTVPIFHGSGTRIKILESMALCKPVISTSKGAEGLEVNDGKHILIKNNYMDFVICILQILRNKPFAEMIGQNARKLIEQKYQWKQIVGNALEIYERFLEVR